MLDTFEEFFYSWSSGIIESRYCNAQFLLRYDGDENTAALPNPNSVSLAHFLPQHDDGLKVDGGQIKAETLDLVLLRHCARKVHRQEHQQHA